MRVFGLMGSPRRHGNTHLLMGRLMEGARSLGAETEIAELATMRIEECDGCHVCWEGLDCPKADDMVGIYRMIERSDAIVFGTPVYWYGPTGIMKLVMDRMVFFNCPEHRRFVRDKLATYLIPFEEKDTGTARPVEEFFHRCFDFLELDTVKGLLVPGMGARGEVSGSWAMDCAYDLGQHLVSVIERRAVDLETICRQ